MSEKSLSERMRETAEAVDDPEREDETPVGEAAILLREAADLLDRLVPPTRK